MSFVGVAVGQARQGWRGLPGWWPRQGQGIGAGLSSRGVFPACVALQSCPHQGEGPSLHLRGWGPEMLVSVILPQLRKRCPGTDSPPRSLAPTGGRTGPAVQGGVSWGACWAGWLSGLLTLSDPLPGREGRRRLPQTHSLSWGPAAPAASPGSMFRLHDANRGSECEPSSRGRETPPLVLPPSFPGVIVADGSVTSLLTSSWLRLALSQQVLAVGQWFPDSEVHQESGQQSDSGQSLRLSQVLRESRRPFAEPLQRGEVVQRAGTQQPQCCWRLPRGQRRVKRGRCAPGWRGRRSRSLPARRPSPEARAVFLWVQMGWVAGLWPTVSCSSGTRPPG